MEAPPRVSCVSRRLATEIRSRTWKEDPEWKKIGASEVSSSRQASVKTTPATVCNLLPFASPSIDTLCAHIDLHCRSFFIYLLTPIQPLFLAFTLLIHLDHFCISTLFYIPFACILFCLFIHLDTLFFCLYYFALLCLICILISSFSLIPRIIASVSLSYSLHLICRCIFAFLLAQPRSLLLLFILIASACNCYSFIQRIALLLLSTRRQADFSVSSLLHLFHSSRR